MVDDLDIDAINVLISFLRREAYDPSQDFPVMNDGLPELAADSQSPR